MNWFRLTDYAVALGILEDPEIKKDIYEDTALITVPDLINETWIGVSEGMEILGCYQLTKRTSIMWEIHARILPKFRKKYAMDASKGVLRWIESNVPGIEKVIAFVPDPFRNVALHCLKVGFTQIGYIPDSYSRNEKIVGLKMYAISMDEIRRDIKCQQPQL